MSNTDSDNDQIIDAEIVDELSKSGPIEDEHAGQDDGESCRDSLPARVATAKNRGERDWSQYSEPKRRCVRVKLNGEQCKNVAILGSTVCRYHGGAAKQVREAARARLENAADLMARELLGMATTSESESVRLSAIRDALDRAGLAKPAQVEIGPMEPKPYEQIFESIATDTRAESRARRGLIDENSAGLTPREENPSDTSGYDAGGSPEAQSSNPPTQSATGDQPRPTSVGRNEAATTPADQGDRATEGSEPTPQDAPQFPKGSTGYDGTGQLARQNPWQPSPDAEYIDPESGEPMSGDEMVLYVARRMNEQAGCRPIQAELESPHRRYRAHRRRSIY